MKTVIVAAAIAPLQAQPSAGSEQVSQRLAGHRLTVLEEREPWLRIRGEDDYEGWVHRGYVSTDGSNRYQHRRTSLGCVVRDPRGWSRPLPLGALVPDDAQLESGEAVPANGITGRFPRNADAITRSAVSLFAGTPYQWGGITPWGADCSGLVQTIFGLHGIALPRDASQQAGIGAAIELASRRALGRRPALLLRSTGPPHHARRDLTRRPAPRSSRTRPWWLLCRGPGR